MFILILNVNDLILLFSAVGIDVPWFGENSQWILFLLRMSLGKHSAFCTFVFLQGEAVSAIMSAGAGGVREAESFGFKSLRFPSTRQLILGLDLYSEEY